MTGLRHWGLVAAFLFGLLVTTGTAQDTKQDPKKDDTKKADDKKPDDKKDDAKKDDAKKDDKKPDDKKPDDKKADDKKPDDTKKPDDKKADDKKPAEPVVPAWKFEKPFSQKWVTKAEQTVTVHKKADGSEFHEPVKYATAVTLDVTWTPDKAAPPPAGQTPPPAKEQGFTLKIDKAAIETEVGKGPKVAVSSDKADRRVPVAAALKALHGAELKVKVNTDPKRAAGTPMVTVTGFEEALAKLPPDEKAALRGVLSKDVLVRQIEAAFPDLPAKEKEATTRKGEVTGGFARYAVETTTTYDKVTDQKQVELKTESKWTFAAAADGAGGAKVEKVDGPVALAGTVTFNPATGMVEKSVLKCTEAKQKVTLKVGTETVTADVVLNYTQEVTAAEKK